MKDKTTRFETKQLIFFWLNRKTRFSTKEGVIREVLYHSFVIESFGETSIDGENGRLIGGVGSYRVKMGFPAMDLGSFRRNNRLTKNKPLEH